MTGESRCAALCCGGGVKEKVLAAYRRHQNHLAARVKP